MPPPSAPAAPSPAADPAPSPTAAPAGARPVDIRQKVDADRGTLKRLQLLIPGYRGYRMGEDIRAADSLLRRQVADKIHGALVQLQQARSDLAQANQFQILNDFTQLTADLQQLEVHIRNAEQGYSGISAAVRVQNADLDRLYEYDYGFAEAADQLSVGVTQLRSTIMASAPGTIGPAVSTVRGQVGQLNQAFQARMKAIEGIQV
jgi:hypothetical protein